MCIQGLHTLFMSSLQDLHSIFSTAHRHTSADVGECPVEYQFTFHQI